jgi:uncharacterized membrane protein YfcA
VSFWECLAILLAGVWAGAINTVVGSGTLITFPVLLAFGVPPVTANVSNTIGLVPGSLSGAWGYRAELVGQRGRLIRYGSAAVAGGVIGAVLLLVLPSSAFRAIVPVLIALGVVLVIVGPQISRRVAARAVRRGTPIQDGPGWMWPAVWGTGIYGGYFGAAQGVLLLAILGIGIDDTLQRHNAVKNLLAAMINGVAAVIFACVADVDWKIAGLIAAGAIVGGQLGAKIGKKLPPNVLRAVIVLVGVVALVSFLV